MKRPALAVLLPVAFVALSIETFVRVDESEPNNERATATPFVLGDSVVGSLDPGFDIDYYSVDLTAGTVLDVRLFANYCGYFEPHLFLLGTDGSVLVEGDGSSNDLCARLIEPIATTGTHYVVVVEARGIGDPSYTYSFTTELAPSVENEPNDTPAQATAVSPGRHTAFMGHPLDVDYFEVGLAAGTRASFFAAGWEFGNYTFHEMVLYSPAGDSLAHWDAERRSPPGAGPISYNVTQSGTYMVRVNVGTYQYASPDSTGPYVLSLDVHRHGAADTLTTFAESLPRPLAMAATRVGRLMIAERDGMRLWEVDATGAASLFAEPPGQAVRDLVVDGAGRLLVAGIDTTGLGAIWNVDAVGTASTLITGLSNPMAIAASPGGEIWVLDAVQEQVVGFDSYGLRFDSLPLPMDISVLWPNMHFSPQGVLHFSNRYAIYRRNGDRFEEAMTLDWHDRVRGFAFDRDGYLYYVEEHENDGVLRLLDPSYDLVDDSLASDKFYNPYGVRDFDIVFLQAPGGGATSRLVMLSWVYDAVFEFNPAGIRAPGAQLPSGLVLIKTDQLKEARVGFAYSEIIHLVNPTAPASWAVVDGGLPEGIQLLSTAGTLGGAPEEAGEFRVRLRVETGDGAGERTLLLRVTEPNTSYTGAALAALRASNSLSPGDLRFLDIGGNDDGTYDIGDFRAFLNRAPAEPPVFSGEVVQVPLDSIPPR